MLLLEHTCDIKRNAAVGTNGRKQLSTIATGIRVLILPMDTQVTIRNGFSLGRGYDAYFEPTQDVQVGDHLSYDNRSFIVRYVQPYLTNMVAHKHAFIEQEVS